jgi:hypothetical protein
MQNKIKEVQDYFKNKILKGDFKVTKVDSYYVDILVDDLYEFTFWSGNSNLPETRKQHGFNFMDLGLTTDEVVVIDSLLHKHIIDFKRNELYDVKVKELERLKLELNITE